MFGNVPAASFVVNADNTITTFAPSQTAGTDDVTVVTPSGTSPVSSADEFTFTTATAPSVSSLITTTGSTAGGTLVTILGSNFTGVTGVNFGTVPATTYAFLADGVIVATAPAQAAGTVDVTVATSSGTSSTSSSDEYTYTNATTPTVSGLDVSSGLSVGGSPVTVLGSGFLGATGVSFGSVAATAFTINSDTSISVVAPPQSAATVDVTVTSPGGTSSTSSADEYTYNTTSLPTLTGLSTSSGSTDRRHAPHPDGHRFQHGLGVNVGTALSTPTSSTVNSDSQITFLTPSQFAGTYDVSVTTAAGTTATSSSTQFTYNAASAPAVSSLGTSSGSTAGGTAVTINGSGFTGLAAVDFGTVPAASFQFVSDSVITAVAPPQAAGTVDVKVLTTAGVSASGSSDHFTYSAASAPSVTSLATTGGSTAGGTLVTINGRDLRELQRSTSARWAPRLHREQRYVDQRLRPSQASATVDVTVTTPSGTSSTSSADHFTYSAASAPSISGLATSTGPTTGGTAFTILGSSFTGATAVTVGGIAVPYFIVNSDSSILAMTPNLAAGTFDVQVTTPSGTSTVVTADEFTVTNVTASAPAVTAIDVNTSSTAGGQVVNITGTNFSGTTAVKFGSTSATFVVNNDSSITATVPAGVPARWTSPSRPTTALPPPAADEFTYLSTGAPTVTSLGTSTGTTAGGTSVAITGTNLSSASAVLFGGLPAPLTRSTRRRVSRRPARRCPPASGTSPSPRPAAPRPLRAGPVHGHGRLRADHHSLGTSTGTTAGGTSVTITGTNLTGTQAVYFDGIPATRSRSTPRHRSRRRPLPSTPASWT